MTSASGVVFASAAMASPRLTTSLAVAAVAMSSRATASFFRAQECTKKKGGPKPAPRTKRKQNSGGGRLADAHPVERPVDEEHRDDEEHRGEDAGQAALSVLRHLHRELHGEEAEERRELDDGVERARRGVLERIEIGRASCRERV